MTQKSQEQIVLRISLELRGYFCFGINKVAKNIRLVFDCWQFLNFTMQYLPNRCSNEIPQKDHKMGNFQFLLTVNNVSKELQPFMSVNLLRKLL